MGLLKKISFTLRQIPFTYKIKVIGLGEEKENSGEAFFQSVGHGPPTWEPPEELGTVLCINTM